MRKLYPIKYYLILSVLLIVIAICCITPSPAFKYAYLKNNCSAQSMQMYKRLYIDTEKVSTAFFGSSHTLQGINDSLLSQTINYGYCRFGRDIQLALFKDVLAQKKIKTAIFEITETEPSYSHPDYPFLAANSDVFFPSLIYNQSFLKNRYDAFLYRLSYVRNELFKKDFLSSANVLRHYGYLGNNASAETSFLEEQKKEKLKDLADYNPNSIVRKSELTFSSHYLTKIKKLAEESKCRVYFIYLPAYGNTAKNSLDSNFYKPFFQTLIPPDSILSNPANWHDEAHLNDKGSEKIAQWLLQNKIL